MSIHSKGEIILPKMYGRFTFITKILIVARTQKTQNESEQVADCDVVMSGLRLK